MKFNLIFLLFVFAFPTLIKALLNCQRNGRCEVAKSNTGFLNFENKTQHGTCEDACVYFKCVTPFGEIMEGAGCYTMFEKVCGYIKTETKTKIIENLRNSTFEYFDEALMFVSCRDKDNCAKDAFEKMNSNNPEADLNFGIYLHDGHFFKNYPESCYFRYLTEDNMQMQNKVLCTTRGTCETGKNYDVKYAGGDVEDRWVKSCDACAYFRWTEDGKNILSASGCYEDFDLRLQDIYRFRSPKIEQYTKNSFIFDEKYVVVSCSTGMNCHKDYYKKYMDVYPKAIIKADENADGACDFDIDF